jgi:ribosomal-protein-alanine N-acetyltransferase
MAAAPGWPASLAHDRVRIRPLRLRDAVAWSELRIHNEEWLARWEGRQPQLPPVSWDERHLPAAFSGMLRAYRREARAGRSLPFAVTYDGDLVGQVTVSGIQRGAAQGGHVGYWLARSHAGRGIMPVALALAVDHCFGAVDLHRVEVNVRPENEASLRVVRKLGFREEGLHSRLLFIDEDWRDHLCFALTSEDQPEGVLRRFLSRQSDHGA